LHGHFFACCIAPQASGHFKKMANSASSIPDSILGGGIKSPREGCSGYGAGHITRIPLNCIGSSPLCPETAHDTHDETGLDVLKREVELLWEQLARERDFNHELSRRLDEEAEERRRLTRLLTHQPEAEPSTDNGGLLRKLFGLLRKLFGRRS